MVIFDEEAIEFLNKLPKEVKERIYNKVISTKENPFHFAQKANAFWHPKNLLEFL